MNHPKTPLPNDDSWSTGDEGFDLRIRMSLAERDSLRAKLDEATEQLHEARHPSVLRLQQTEGALKLVEAKLAAAEKERDEWRRLSGMDCDGMNCPPSAALTAERAARDLRVASLIEAAQRALHPSCVAVWQANPKSPVCCFVCEQVQAAAALLKGIE